MSAWSANNRAIFPQKGTDGITHGGDPYGVLTAQLEMTVDLQSIRIDTANSLVNGLSIYSNCFPGRL